MTTLILRARRELEEWSTTLRVAAVFAALLVAGVWLFQMTHAMLAGHLKTYSGTNAALLATLVTALATGSGAAPVLLARTFPVKAQNSMLGFGAGVMLAASVFSLILPAIDAGTLLTGSKWGGGLITAAGIVTGGLLLLALDKAVPHEHLIKGHAGRPSRDIARVWLFVFAITLHNVPEGLAIGVAFAGDNPVKALPLALGIAVQNMPEGLAVALALLTLNYTPARAALIALGTGLVEPLGALIGAGAVAVSGILLPWGLAFAAGAMIFVVIHEIIPETHRHGHETPATIGLLSGFVLMMLFDTTLS